ncbi:MAG: preprotein translocase subunit YajC [Christensenellales bacterium]|jgi:preprotein translocase subunit YajC
MNFNSLPSLALNADAVEGSEFLSTVMSLVPILLIVVLFYFFMIRPQRKRDKAVKEMLSKIGPGDKIVTIGGIYGKVVRAKDDIITIEVGSERTQMLVARWAIRNVVGDELENEGALDAAAPEKK